MMPKSYFRTLFTISFRPVATYGNCIPRTQLAHFSYQIPSVTVRQADIRDKDVTLSVRNFVKCLFFAASAPNRISRISKIKAKRMQQVGIIFDDKYSQTLRSSWNTRHINYDRLPSSHWTCKKS